MQFLTALPQTETRSTKGPYVSMCWVIKLTNQHHQQNLLHLHFNTNTVVEITSDDHKRRN